MDKKYGFKNGPLGPLGPIYFLFLFFSAVLTKNRFCWDEDRFDRLEQVGHA